MQYITANPGPVVARGLRAALGVVVDVSGAGASRWVQQPYNDPFQGSERWEAGSEFGIVYQGLDETSARNRGAAETFDLCESHDIDRGEATEGWEYAEGPFSLISMVGPTVGCSTFTMGAVDPDEYAAEALRRHEETFWPKIEEAIWRGPSTTKTLAGSAEVVSPLSRPIDLALAELEGRFIARFPTERGIIWMPAGTSHLLKEAGVELDNRNMTREGNVVVFVTALSVENTTTPESVERVDGDGADGCFQFWAYMTPRLQLRLGAPTFDAGDLGAMPVIHHLTNDMVLNARQTVAWAWKGSALAVQVAVETCSCCHDRDTEEVVPTPTLLVVNPGGYTEGYGSQTLIEVVGENLPTDIGLWEIRIDDEPWEQASGELFDDTQGVLGMPLGAEAGDHVFYIRIDGTEFGPYEFTVEEA